MQPCTAMSMREALAERPASTTGRRVQAPFTAACDRRPARGRCTAVRAESTSTATKAQLAQPVWTGDRVSMVLMLVCRACSIVFASLEIACQQSRWPACTLPRPALKAPHLLAPFGPVLLHAPPGDTLASRVVNFAINSPPIYGVMKLLAKQAMKGSAESRGISWDRHVRQMAATAEVGCCVPGFSYIFASRVQLGAVHLQLQVHVWGCIYAPGQRDGMHASAPPPPPSTAGEAAADNCTSYSRAWLPWLPGPLPPLCPTPNPRQPPLPRVGPP